jgi:hypothetical protein
LYLYNTEIAGNIADNGNKSGQIMGGGAYCGSICMVTNSTISGNYSRTDCGGINLGNGVLGQTNKVVNSTISNNVAELGNGGGIYTYGANEFINSIIWGNTAVKGKDLYQVNSHVYAVYPIRSIIGDTSGNLGRAKIVGSFISTDPKLDTLKFNCSITRTHALLQGSSALDSGAMADSIPALDQRGWAPFNNKDIGAMEMVYQIQFEIGKDTVCTENKEVITLKTNTNGGTFEGEGVSGNTFDVSKITKSGFVTITYKYSAPGCENFTSSDSIYVKICTPSKVKNFASLNACIYPNPANDQIIVKHNSVNGMNITIFDLSGKSIAKYSSNENSMNISLKSFTAGMYLVMVESNGLKSTQKLIKN